MPLFHAVSAKKNDRLLGLGITSKTIRCTARPSRAATRRTCTALAWSEPISRMAVPGRASPCWLGTCVAHVKSPFGFVSLCSGTNSLCSCSWQAENGFNAVLDREAGSRPGPCLRQSEHAFSSWPAPSSPARPTPSSPSPRRLQQGLSHVPPSVPAIPPSVYREARAQALKSDGAAWSSQVEGQGRLLSVPCMCQTTRWAADKRSAVLQALFTTGHSSGKSHCRRP